MVPRWSLARCVELRRACALRRACVGAAVMSAVDNRNIYRDGKGGVGNMALKKCRLKKKK